MFEVGVGELDVGVECWGGQKRELEVGVVCWRLGYSVGGRSRVLEVEVECWRSECRVR